MFFYYIPRALLKKKPINVYEVPKRFNINETEYLKKVDALYQVIKSLRQDFIDTEQRLWTNITISIAHNRFKIEFNYDKISEEEYASYVRHIIWRYKYLHLGGELKEERKILDKYLNKPETTKEDKEEYQAGMYVRNFNNAVGYVREVKAAQEKQEELKEKAIEQEEKRQKKLEEKAKIQEEKRRKAEENNKNQILKM